MTCLIEMPSTEVHWCTRIVHRQFPAGFHLLRIDSYPLVQAETGVGLLFARILLYS